MPASNNPPSLIEVGKWQICLGLVAPLPPTLILLEDMNGPEARTVSLTCVMFVRP